MYDTEAAFGRAIMLKLNKAGYGTQRIESHSTTNGIPDMFVQGYGKDFWIELKNSKHVKTLKRVQVDWRPGQQAWSHDYYLLHKKQKQTVTLMSIQEGMFIIPMWELYPGNIVNDPWFLTYEELKLYHSSVADITRLFTFATHNLDYSSFRTYRDAVIFWVEQYYPDDYDYDPEVIWPLSNVSIDAPCEPGLMNKVQFDLWRNLG